MSLPEEEKIKILLQVDHFISEMEQRSGLTFSEVIEIIKWSRDHKNLFEKLGVYGLFVVMGTLIAAALAALWKGLRIGL